MDVLKLKRNVLDIVKCVFIHWGRTISTLLLQLEPDVFPSKIILGHCLLLKKIALV